jgi:beta-glucuronidase
MMRVCRRILPPLLLSAAAVLCTVAAAQQSAGSEAFVQPTLLVDVDHRAALDLDGDWHYILDPYQGGLYTFHHELKKDGIFLDREPPVKGNDLVEYSFAKSPTLKVPGDWNTQSDRLYYYEGLLWYQRDFDYTPKPATRAFVHIGAANYRANLFVNGKHICDHEGGFTPFDCEVTKVLHPGHNFAVIAVDNTRIADGVPTLNTDWWNYGGLTRDVSLVTVPESFIDDYDLHLNRTDRETGADSKTIEGYVHVVDAAPGAKVRVRIPELKLEAEVPVDANGRAAITLKPSTIALWGPGHPKLYKVELSSSSAANGSSAQQDTLTDDLGFRTIEVQGTKILLNGEPVFLHGIAIHAEAPYRTGRAYSQADVSTLLDWAQQLGCNFVRLAHYPHDQRMTRETDRRGILVWSEIPDYWALHFDDPAVYAKSQQQLGEEIRRDRDKASVILWSVANETPNTPVRTQYLSNLAAYAHELDSTRLVTAALLVRGEGNTKIVDDPLGKALDVIGTNEYIGWYEKTPADAARTTWSIAYNKPLIMTEFGGGAKAGLHGSEDQRWTEEYQAAIYRNQILMLNNIPQLRGMSPWILMDFRSPVRLLPGVQDGFNRKGLLAPDGQKKQAFFVLQKAYQDNAVGKPQ